MKIALNLAALMILLSMTACQPPEEAPTTYKSLLDINEAPSSPLKLSAADLQAAKDEHLVLLEKGMAYYKNKDVKDYTCTFIKQERIDGSLTERQTVDVKFMPKPFSIAMVWVKNPPMGDKLVYVQGKFKDKEGKSQMVVQPTSPAARWIVGGSVLKLPDCADALKSSRRPCTDFDVENMMKNLIDVYKEADKAGDLKEYFGGYTTIGGRQCMVLIRVLDKKAPSYPAKTTEICLDAQTYLPLRVIGYDWENRLDADYVFEDLKFNVGLTEKDFTPQALGIKGH